MPKKISDIVRGDKVKVYNTEDETFSFSNVVNIWKHTSEHYYLLNGETKVTEMHPYYVEGAWIMVKDLKEGDKLLNKSGDTVPIESIERIEEDLLVYNMEVEGQHNYFANDILVHNGKGGTYIGKDKYKGSDVGASRSTINDAADDFNTVLPDSVGTALGSQLEAARTFKDSVGLTAATMDGTQEGNTGFQKVLIDSLADNARNLLTTQKDVRSSKTTSLKSAGDAFRETQKSVNQAKETSGMVSGNERMQLDMDVNLGGATGAAQLEAEEGMQDALEEKTFEDAKAHQDLKDAVAKAAIDMENAMGDQVNSVVDTTHKQTTNFNQTYKDTVGNLKKRQKKNAAGRVKSGETSQFPSNQGIYGTAIDQSNYTTTQTDDPGEVGSGQFAITSSIDMKGTTGVKDAVDSLSTKFKMGNFAGMDMTTTGETQGSESFDQGEVTATIDPMTSIQSVWSGASGDAKLQQVIGPGNMDSVGGNSQYIVPRCFAGDTIILTEES